APSDLFVTSLFGDQQLGGDTTHLAGMIAENSTLKHGSIDTARGHRDLTERRLESSVDENQTFGTIFYSCVSKMQHNDQGFGIFNRPPAFPNSVKSNAW